jgi:hypothetical protein
MTIDQSTRQGWSSVLFHLDSNAQHPRLVVLQHCTLYSSISSAGR